MADEHGTWKRLGDGSLPTEDPEVGLGHILPIETYKKVLVTLLVLTFVTVVVSRFDFGDFNAIVAIFVATIKAALVAMFFMHLKFEGKLIIAYVFYPIILVTLLIGSNVADVNDRQPVYPETYTAPAAAPGSAAHDAHH